MMIWRDVQWQFDFDLLRPHWICAVMQDWTGDLRDELIFPGTSIDALKWENSKLKFY